MVTLPISINSSDKILVVAPHPDDESIGVGGLISIYSKQVDVAIMTDGRYGNEVYEPQNMKRIREKELIAAMKIVGVKNYKLYGVEDGTLINNAEVFESIDYSKYMHVFLPNPEDNHSDHTACYKYVINNIKKRELSGIQVYQYEVHKPLSDGDCHLDISEVIENKVAMVQSHESQMSIHDYARQVRCLAEYRGIQNEQVGRLMEVYQRINIFSVYNRNIGIEKELAKYKQFTRVLLDWLRFETDCSSLDDYFIKFGYRSVAIYGYGILGRVLYDKLRNSKCAIAYFIDKNETVNADIPTYHKLENLPYVDIVIVTTALEYENIIRELENNNHLTCRYIGDIFKEEKDG